MHSKFSHQYLLFASLKMWQDQGSGAGIRTDAGQCAKKPWPWSLVRLSSVLWLGPVMVQKLSKVIDFWSFGV